MDQRTIQRIICIAIVVITLFSVGIIGQIADKSAQEEGYTDATQKNAIALINANIKQYKQINFITDNTIPSNNLMIEALEADDYRPVVNKPETISYLENEAFTNISDQYITIVNGGILFDYLYNSMQLKYDKDKVKINIFYTISGFKDNMIVIISPFYEFETDEELDAPVSYEEFVEIVKEGCEQKGISYIDLYTYTKNNPVKITEDKVPPYSDDMCNYIYTELSPILRKSIEKHAQDYIDKQNLGGVVDIHDNRLYYNSY